MTIANAGAGAFILNEVVNVTLNGQPYAGAVVAAGATASVSLTAPATAGTYAGVVSMTGAPSVPFTLVVGSAAGILNYKTSKVYIDLAGATDLAADGATLSASATGAPATAVGQVTVHQFSDLLGLNRTADLQTAAVTATISGAGAIGLASGTRGSYISVAAGTANSSLSAPALAGVQNFYIYPDSRTGKATISVSVNGVVASTKTFTFTGATASVKDVTAAPKTYIGVLQSDTFTIAGYDANGNKSEANAAAIDYAVSSDSTVATATATNGTVVVSGVKSGTATITVCDTASCVSPTLSTTIKVTITGTTIGSIALALDSTSYEPGAKMVLTATVKDTAGQPIADGTYTLFTVLPDTNVNLVGWPTAAPLVGAAPVTVKGGVATLYTGYAPFTSGSVVITATDALAAANVLTASAVVSGPTDAAIDAANEATDAANAATDAANAAAEAADAATAAAQDAQAAVAELATQVAGLIASIKAQITSLTNLVVKTQKKVKA